MISERGSPSVGGQFTANDHLQHLHPESSKNESDNLQYLHPESLKNEIGPKSAEPNSEEPQSEESEFDFLLHPGHPMSHVHDGGILKHRSNSELLDREADHRDGESEEARKAVKEPRAHEALRADKEPTAHEARRARGSDNHETIQAAGDLSVQDHIQRTHDREARLAAVREYETKHNLKLVVDPGERRIVTDVTLNNSNTNFSNTNFGNTNFSIDTNLNAAGKKIENARLVEKFNAAGENAAGQGCEDSYLIQSNTVAHLSNTGESSYLSNTMALLQSAEAGSTMSYVESPSVVDAQRREVLSNDDGLGGQRTKEEVR
jgi:hypothetical protein